jgi:molybdopterin-guanine dinucleotide biosynthesis protein A
MKITAIILAGGQARRLDNIDKGLLNWRGKTFVEHLISKFQSDTEQIIISCNRNVQTYQGYGLPVVTDNNPDYLGPLAGIQAALALCKSPLALILPCDCPLLPDDLIPRLQQALIDNSADVAIPYDGERLQYLPALIRTDMQDSLSSCLEARKLALRNWYGQYKLCQVDFSDSKNCFININTEQDYSNLES